ncbi:WxL domain-containing protein [Enterococcus casseliflavus]|uniref:WxL domain-containing protein n=1 Tax=Enterococcus TaxID=1350 RepID=UPI00215922C9|nr:MULTISPECIES: WxL domain-containing protein [Enterococcus]WEL47165.1 WxL domain-containing protein [Enterococcus casseliflavus]
MKRFLTTLLVFLLTSGPCFSYAMVVAQAESVTKTSEEQSMSSSDPVVSSIDSLEETNETEVQASSEPASTDSSTGATDTASAETEASSEAAEEVQVTFLTDTEHVFANGETRTQISKNKGEALKESDLPVFEDDTAFEGWSLDGTVYTSQALTELILTENQTLTAVFKPTVKARAADISLAEQSIKEIIAEADKTKVIAVPSPAGDDSAYAEYTNSAEGIRQALFDMYQNGNGQEFALYVGSGGSLSLPTNLTSKTIPATIDNTNMTFYALQGKVSRLIITGHGDDPITDATTLTSGSRTVALGTDIYFGSDVVIRNLNYTGTRMYMNGHSLSLNGGSTGNGLAIYGGSNNGDLTGNPTITVNATGSGTWNIYGGNQSGGTLTGNTAIVVNNTVGGISTIAGGANIGTIDGNTNVAINRLNGTLGSYYGGGLGTNASNTANVTGNVETTIQTTNTSFRLSAFTGGVQYGNIGGTIRSTISGAGGWSGTANRFIGGSFYGNIGSDRSKDAIVTNLDASSYSTGRSEFEGGNRNTGTITGNIVNTVKAGPSASVGGIGDFNGGGGNNVSTLTQSSMGASNTTTYDNYTPEQRAALAEAAASFKVYGDITSHLVSGSFSNGAIYSTAAGRGGYVEGNTTIEVGTITSDGSPGGDGIAYTGTRPTNLDYSTTNKTRGNASGWDIVGGGGYPGTAWDIYIKGNTKTILNNTVARWTYGGSFSGVIEGNSSNTLNSGIVDTLEGTGYTGRRVYGDGRTTVNNGQVDWFLSGGGWDDLLVTGNVAVTVYDGVINASLGASYGVASSHTINGNSDNRVFGGNFSGTPRTGSNGFSGGVTNNGRLLGNASLTLDLRDYDGEFALPSGTNISGGNPFNSTNIVGTDSSNTITLNIYTKPGSDALNGATIYGDGGRTASNTRSGKIYMNIQAEGSSIGNLYTTYYSNISSSQILRDVEMRVQGAKSINGISGGNASDNFTNTIVANSSNQVKMSFGENVDGTASYQTDPIAVTGLGIVNFTELNVTNGIKLMANGGDIKNGRSATAANHATTYHQFGDIHLSKDAGIGISSATNLISGAKLTVEDKGTIESPPGTGRINLSDFATPDTDKDHLTWLKTTTNDAGSRVNSQGTWFGAVSAYQVLTINPTAANAAAITPINFSGIEKATGKTFIGDNDVTNAANGYGIAIPGSIINYEVETPGVANGIGAISHNVTAVKENNTPLTLQAWGTEQAGTQVQKGRLLIPYTVTELPTLTFTPETQTSGSWVYAGQIKSSKLDSTDQQLTEQPDSEPVDWTSPDGEYSYDISVRYSNKAEVQARNVILTEQEAQSLTKEQAVTYLEASGRPFFKDTLTDEVLAAIQEPLETAVYRKQAITFSVGENDQNQEETTVNLVVVKNESVISDDRQFAVYAKDVRLTLPEAMALTDEAALADYTQATTIFADNRANIPPTVDPQAFAAIQQATEDELLKNVSTAYHYEAGSQRAEKVVNVAVAGELILSSVPTDFDFGQQKVATETQDYWPTITGELAVKDTRGSERSPWRLTVKEQQPLTDGTDQLTDVFRFVTNGQEQMITSGEMIIEETELTENGTYVVNQHWGESQNEGIKLTVPVEQQKVGDYQGTLSWQLVSAPGNP